MVSQMLIQCFDVLNTYGKPPEAIENIIMMFQSALANENPEDIKKAFVGHIQNNTVMPTPADILHRVSEFKTKRAKEKYYDGLLAGNYLPPPPKKYEGPTMFWNDLTDDEKKHLLEKVRNWERPERALFLRSWKVPEEEIG